MTLRLLPPLPAPRPPSSTETLLTCACGWDALRPDLAIVSAKLAHATWHARGFYPGDARWIS